MCLKAISKFLCLLFMCFFTLSIDVEAKEVYDVPTNSSFKAYMSYEAITDSNSKQYKLQQNCVTDNNGLRTYNGYYTIALGNGFNIKVGDYVDVVLQDRSVLRCVVGDVKQNAHTDASNKQVAHNGNVVEFIVDTDVLDSDALRSGDISSIKGFEGEVISITVYSDNDVKSLNWEKVCTTTDSQLSYLILAKYETPLPSGESLYTVEYAFGNDFNSIICSEDFYNEVEVGSSVVNL